MPRRIMVIIDIDEVQVQKVQEKVERIQAELDYEVKEYCSYYNFDWDEDKTPSDQIEDRETNT